MKLGDIKAEALKLMFANYDVDITADTISDLYDNPSLKNYLFAMPGAINRCFNRFKSEMMLREKAVTITPTEGDYYSTFDLSTITDLFEISRITYTDDYGDYFGSVSYQLEGDTLILFQSGGEYHLIYYAEPPIIYDVAITADTTEIDLPIELLSIVPFYIKGELYQEDQPELAAEAMAIFEQKLARTPRKKVNNQTEIKDIYTML